jgi:hypothetical protein
MAKKDEETTEATGDEAPPVAAVVPVGLGPHTVLHPLDRGGEAPLAPGDHVTFAEGEDEHVADLLGAGVIAAGTGDCHASSVRTSQRSTLPRRRILSRRRKRDLHP